MDNKKVKRLGDEQRTRKTKEKSAKMTNKFLRRFITEIVNRRTKLPTSRIGRRFAALLKKRTKYTNPLDDCSLLLRELKVEEGSYQLAAMSPGRVEALAGVGDSSFWALEEQLEEEDFPQIYLKR